MHRLFVLPAAAALIAGSAALSADKPAWQARQDAQDAAKMAKVLAGLTPQKPMSCIDQTRIHDTLRFGDTVLYKYSPREFYRADTNGGCFGLRRGDALVTDTPTGFLCSGDILRTVDLVSRTPSGSCTFHEVVPYKR